MEMPRETALRRILAAWDVAPARIEASGAQSALGVWFVRGEDRELVLRRLRDAEVADREARLLAACREGTPVPEVIPTRLGLSWHVDDEGRIWQLQTRAAGCPLPGGFQGPQAENAYRILARVHAELRRAPWDIPDRQDHYARYGPRLGAGVDAARDAFPGPGSAASAALDAWRRGEAALRGRPRQWIHGDTHQGNFLMDEGGRVSALVDFAEARIDAAEWDLAGALASFARTDGHWAEDVEAAMAGYRDTGGEVEEAALRTAYIGWQLRGLCIWSEARGEAADRLVPGLLRGLEQALRWRVR